MISTGSRSVALANAAAKATAALREGVKAAWMEQEPARHLAALHDATVELQAHAEPVLHRDDRALLLESARAAIDAMGLLKELRSSRMDAQHPMTVMIARTQNYAAVLLATLNRSPAVATTPL